MPTPIRGRDSLTVVQAQLAVRSVTPYDVRPVATANYVARMHKHCTEHGLVLRVLLTQFLHETGYAGPNGRWDELNPAGLGITNGADNTPYRIDTGEQAADVHAWSMLVALREWDKAAKIVLPPVFDTWKKRWTAKYQNPACPVVNNIEDLNDIYRINGDINATWAVDAEYDAKMLRIMPAVFTLGSVQWGTPPETPNMSIPYAAPPLEIAITPYNNDNRPKLAMDPEFITVHEVGNTSPGADEDMHRDYVHNGGGPGRVSFQFIAGPRKVIQLLPIDEAAWHASDGYNGTGNRRSIAIETIQIGDFDKTLWNLAWLINELATNPGRFFANHPKPEWKLSIEKIKQHHDWAPDGKNCPQFIRDRGLWPELMRRVDLWNAAGAPVGVPYPAPITYDWLDPAVAAEGIDRVIGKTPVFYLPQTYTAVKRTARRRATCNNTEVIGPDIEPGLRFRADYVYRSCGRTYVLTPYGTRVHANDLEPRVQIGKPPRWTISINKTPGGPRSVVRRVLAVVSGG